MKKITELVFKNTPAAQDGFGELLVARLLTLPELESVSGGDGTGSCGSGPSTYGSSGGGSFTQQGGQFQQTGGSYKMSCTPAPAANNEL